MANVVENVEPEPLLSRAEARERWVHEDELIGNRLGWLMGSQTLLFAAFGLAAAPGKPNSTTHRLLSILPFLGTGISLAIGLGVVTALIAMSRILRACTGSGLFLVGGSSSNADPKVWRPDVSRTTTVCGWLAAVSLPAMFTLAWAALALQ